MKRAHLWVALAVLAGCHGVDRKVNSKGEVQSVIDQQPVGSGYLEAIGIGGSDPSLPSETQRKSLARDAAIIKAQYEMLSMVKGVEIEGGIKVSRAIEQDSTLESKIKDVIRGSEVLKTEFTSDHGAVVTIRLSKRRLEQMMGVRFK